MRCPFLREATVRYCRAAPMKKMIVQRPGQTSGERCSSADYANCPLVKQRGEPSGTAGACPFLDECLVQYCAAASVTKYIPYSESGLSRCGQDSHRFCDLYLAVASAGEQSSRGESVDGIHIPAALWYAPNHLWLDRSPDGMLHVGIDALMAAVLGTVDRVEFVSAQGRCRPSLVMSVRDAELSLVFPNELTITRANAALRNSPARITEHPYGSGWLFEAVAASPAAETRNLLPGAEAPGWMHGEVQRLTEAVQALDAAPALADGGQLHRAQLARLPRTALLRLFNDFFALP